MGQVERPNTQEQIPENMSGNKREQLENLKSEEKFECQIVFILLLIEFGIESMGEIEK